MRLGKWLLIGTLAPCGLAFATSSGMTTAASNGPTARARAWRADPPAAGSMAIRPTDHLVTGRVASVSGREVTVENDLGGDEKLVVPRRLAGKLKLAPGDVVTASYHVKGPAREVDRIVRGDVSAAATPGQVSP